MVLLTIYRNLFYSKEVNAKFWAIRSRHRNKHIRRLTEGAVPIFVAATIASAMLAIFTAISHDVMVEVVLSFIWAIIIAKGIGYFIVYNVNDTTNSYAYLYKVGAENCAFALKEAMTLLLIDVLVEDHDVMAAFGGWIIVVLVIIVIVLTSNLAQIFWIKPDHVTTLRVKFLEAEVYALGTAYTLNIIFLGAACGPEFIDIFHADADDEHTGDNSDSFCGAYSFFYPAILLVLFGYLLSTGVLDHAAEMVEEAEELKEATQAGHVDHSNHVTNSKDHSVHAVVNAKNSVVSAGMEMKRPTSSTTDDAVEVEVEVRDSEMGRDSEFQAEKELKCASFCAALSTACEPLDYLCCSWDAERRTRSSFGMILVLFLGNYLGCAFYTWSLISFHFKAFGLPAGQVLAAFVFAVLVSVLAVEYMTMYSTRLEIAERDRNERILHKRRMEAQQRAQAAGVANAAEAPPPTPIFRKKRVITKQMKQRTKLMVMACSLLAGLAWESFVLGAVQLTFAKEGDGTAYYNTRAIVYTVVAVVATLLGKVVDDALHREEQAEQAKETREDEEEEREFRASLAEADAAGGGPGNAVVNPMAES